MNEVSEAAKSLRPAIGVGVVVLRGAHETREVLLIRRGNPPMAGEWSIPGGRQEWSEGVRETAVREVMEETGVRIGDLRLVEVVDRIERAGDGAVGAHWTLVDFRAAWVSGEPRPGNDAADARWVPFAELDRYELWDETRRVIAAAAAMG